MDTLLTDLFQAYYNARQNKRNTPSQLRFEMNLESNLIELYHELRNFRYKPSPSVCFVVQDSVKREVFASEFRDRVVHHLYYNYVSALFDRRFIHDSYSCRKGKGTLMGIERIEHHIRSVSRNYTRKAYILKMDIKGYFMSIDRTLLCSMVHEEIERIPLSEDVKALVFYLTDIIAKKDPMQGAIRKGSPCDWDDLPSSKCLSCSPQGVGMPIGDLTSQLFSNVFLGKLDWFVYSTLGFKHYGRYVDDFYIVDTTKQHLVESIPEIEAMLASIGLKLNSRKVKVQAVDSPISYLGSTIHPYYRHCSSRTMRHFERHKSAYLRLHDYDHPPHWLNVSYCLSSVNSYYGYLGHFKAYGQLKVLCQMS